MDGVTDQPYRHIQKKYGQPAVLYTEFTSTEGVCHGADRLLQDFLYDETQRPIIAQIYGTTPAYFRQCAVILCQLGFDGIDINMGCPAKNVAHSGAGAALIKTPDLAREIIRETKAGVQDWLDGMSVQDCPDITESIAQEIEKRQALLPDQYQARDRRLPVSVKTRVGYDKPIVHEWIPQLLAEKPAAIALHGRTLKQQYSGLASWEEIGKAAELVKQTNTLILGNGDIQTRAETEEKISTFGVHGALLGRSTFGNPYVFHAQIPVGEPSLFEIALEHAQLFEQTYRDLDRYNFLPMRKHLGWYVRGVPGASEIRVKLFQSNSATEVAEILKDTGLIE